MTINYLDAKRIQGLSTDIAVIPTFEDDFSGADNWIDNDVNTGVNTTTDNLAFDFNASNVNRGSYYDLVTVSNTSWVLRFSLKFSTLVASGNGAMYVILSDTHTGSNTYTSQKAIGLQLYEGSANNDSIRLTHANNQALYINGQAGAYATTFSINTDYYFEIIRVNSTTIKLNYYGTDSTYNSPVTTISKTIVDTIQNTHFLKIHQEQESGAGKHIGVMDNIKFWNNTPSNKPTIAIPLTGCKAYYKFEETSGNLINQATTANGFTDGLGSSADGTNNGATQTATGKIGNAWDFDGSNDFVQLSNYFNFLHNPSTSGTISAWIKHDVNSGGQFIISTFGNANDVNGIWTGSLGGMVFGLRPDGNPYYATVADNPSAWVVAENASNNLATGVWYNIVFTKENNTFKVYVNGVLDASITASSTLRSGNSYATPTIGKHSDGSGYVFLNGGIDDLSIWSRALTTNEITNLYNSGSGKLLDTQTNIQTNSIFEQTDNSVRYWYDGTVWKNNGSPSVSKIGVFGGSNAPNAYIANYETLNLSTNVWTSSGSLTSARARTSTGSTISDVYIIGGQNGSGYHATVEKINWSTNGMTSTSDFTYAPSHTSANAPTFCQILSYYFASYFTNSRKYTYANNSSVAGTSLSYHHAFSSAFGDKTKGIITNGNSTGANHTEMYTYASDTVTQKANPPSSSSGVSGGHSGNKTTGVQCDSTNAHLYNLSSDVWTTNGFTGMESVSGGTAVGSTNEDYYMMGTSTSVTNTKKKNYSSGVYTSLVSFANNHTNDTVSGACNDNWGVNY